MVYLDPEKLVNEQLLLEEIRFVHSEVISATIRSSPVCNELGLPYVRPELVLPYLTKLLEFVNESMMSIAESPFENRLLLSILFFDSSLWIHPFSEGNGRTARLLFSRLMKPMTGGISISFFLQSDSHPRHEYITSIRANPTQAPVCLAFYVLKSLLENTKRILDVLQPLKVVTDKKAGDVKMSSSSSGVGGDIDFVQKTWKLFKEEYAAVYGSNLQWLFENKDGYW